MPSSYLTIEPTEDLQQQVECRECKRETHHKVLASIRKTIDADHETVWLTYRTLSCLGCGTISFCEESRNSEDVEWNEEAESLEPNPTYIVYPERQRKREELPESELLPTGVHTIYRETLGAHSRHLLILAALGIRTIIEAVCKDRAAPGKDLQQRIESLISMGLISKDGGRILHGLRLIGNEAAHEVKVNSFQELSLALDVVDHLLTGVYIFPKVTSHLPSRKRVP